MFPVSILSLIIKVVTPVYLSPLIIAWCIGAAPLYLGRSDACKFTAPIEGIWNRIFGNFLNATIIKISGLISFIFSMKLISLKETGWNIGNPIFWASIFIAEEVNALPLPEGLSGAVITAELE